MAILKYRNSFDVSIQGRLGGQFATFNEGRPNIAKRFFGEKTIILGRKKDSGSRGSVKGSLGEFLRIKTPSPEPLLARSTSILESNFPGGEATRVMTPPPPPSDSDSDTEGLTRQPTLPGDIHSDECRNLSRRRSLASRRRGRERMASLFGWPAPSHHPTSTPTARSTPGHTRTPSDTVRRGGRRRRLGDILQRRSVRDLRMLVVDTAVPEHGPDSTLCPRHPDYVAGGKGVCLYHGGKSYVVR